MAEKTKLTKNELQRQQRELKKYQRYLPTLQLKKQQLQLEVRKADVEWENRLSEYQKLKLSTAAWIELFSDFEVADWEKAVAVQQIHVDPVNIAGVKVQIFKSIDFQIKPYSYFSTPPWFDFAIQRLKDLLKLREQVRLLAETVQALKNELRKTTQRVNLFEKVMIPRCEENIRVIKIYLGDEERNAVGRAKIAKKKIATAA
ncbi:V-type ATP synthase subunit D [candidate division KSB1 bacterium]|nr:V-type ATP synthase subunit D [candidate division KSB1 bacterium]